MSDALWQRVEQSLARQGMMQHLGARLLRVAVGECDLQLPFSERASQQQGSFHGGAIGALADIAGGYAALTVAAAEMEVVTVEYKINFLAACTGGELLASGKVLRGGRRVIVTSAEVFHLDAQGQRKICAVMQQTLAPVPKTYS
jgi:uncharacterized protein (TIGR00369 family)